MAGGGKLSPRQQMINMMYLVLTALLALQVSNSVLQKFIFIDKALTAANTDATSSNVQVVTNIGGVVKENGNRERDVAVYKKAQEVRKKTAAVMEYLAEVRAQIIEVSGGTETDPETGKITYLGEKDYDKQMSYTLGAEGSKSGEGYTMETKLNSYADELNEIFKDFVLPSADSSGTPQKVDEFKKLAKPASEIPEFANDPDQQSKDFAQLQFDHTPTVACLAVMSQIQAEVLKYETKALETLAKSIGADQIKFDKIEAVVRPTSTVVANGTEYEALMFIAASSENANPKMRWSGGSVPVEDGKGKVKFVAKVGSEKDYDAEGNAKKTWKGFITIKDPLGKDTTYEVEEEYIIAKPVIQVQAAAVQALYFNCGNELNIQVPALGNVYDPSYKVAGGDYIKGSKKGLVTVVPKSKKVGITVFSGGNRIGVQNFKVRAIPKPDVVLLNGGKPANLKDGESAANLRKLKIKAIPDKDFASFLPKDAQYKVAEWEVTLARGKRAVMSQKVKSGSLSLTSFASKAKPGDRYVVEVKKVVRMNFKREIEEVKGLGLLLFTVPLN